jgi:hypothetical protein
MALLQVLEFMTYAMILEVSGQRLKKATTSQANGVRYIQVLSLEFPIGISL